MALIENIQKNSMRCAK